MTGERQLYKYLDIEGGLKMFEFSNLQFTNSTRLNDPFDCHPALFDFSNVPSHNLNLELADFFKAKGETDMENLRNKAWVCSLSKIHDSVPMWAYYGNHKGVCVGLNMENARKYLSKIHCAIYTGAIEIEVQYRDVIEKPDYFHGNRDVYHYLLSTKAKDWAHEQEVRLVLENPSPTIMALSNDEIRVYPHLGGECFESLYLGIKIDKIDKERIIKEAIKCNPSIKIYQMTVDPEAFRLKEQIIDF